jgi:hypothetical protein
LPFPSLGVGRRVVFLALDFVVGRFDVANLLRFTEIQVKDKISFLNLIAEYNEAQLKHLKIRACVTSITVNQNKKLSRLQQAYNLGENVVPIIID